MNNNEPDFYDNSTLAEIQLQLSCEIDSIDEDEIRIDELYGFLDKLYEGDSDFKRIYKSEKNILKNDSVLNTLFFKFIISLPKKKYKLYHVFVVFCDYFELPYDRCFNCLSTKIQRFLDVSLKRILGQTVYKKYHKKHKLNNEDIKLNLLSDL